MISFAIRQNLWEDIVKYVSIILIVHFLLYAVDERAQLFDEFIIKLLIYVTIGLITYHMVIKKFVTKKDKSSQLSQPLMNQILIQQSSDSQHLENLHDPSISKVPSLPILKNISKISEGDMDQNYSLTSDCNASNKKKKKRVRFYDDQTRSE